MKLLYKFLLTILLICIVFPLSVVTHEFGHALTGLSLGLKNAYVTVWPGWQIYPDFDRSNQNNWPKTAIATTRFGPSVTAVSWGLVATQKSDWSSILTEPNLDDSNYSYWPKSNIVITDFDHNNANYEYEYSLDYQIRDNQPKLVSPEILITSDSVTNGLILFMGSGVNWLASVVALFLLARFKKSRFILIACTPIAFLYYDLVTYTLLPALFGLQHFVFWGGSDAEPLIGLITLGVNKQLAIIVISAIALVQTIVTFNTLKQRNMNCFIN
jgi:hypothetical protein